MANMRELIAGFSSHLAQAVQIGISAKLRRNKNTIHNILVCGLGGSGIGGTIAAHIIENQSNVPVLSAKDYFIPEFVNENTLVIISSYSGNTEETLSTLAQAEKKNAEIACITSGGKIAEIAKEKNYNLIEVPGGLPPRAAFGLTFPQLFFLFKNYEIIDFDFVVEIQNSINYIDNNEEIIKSEAKKITDFLFEKIPVLYSDTAYEGLLWRFRQQLNENAKMLAWHHVFPEMNHNELVGWRNENENLAVLILRSEKDYSRTAKRMDISKEIIKKCTPHLFELKMKGDTTLTTTLNTIHLLDWVSLLLAEKKGIDPMEVKVIDYLKGELSKI